VLDETTDRGHLRETHLPFEGFLEALCRLAGLKALPRHDEIEEAGAADAGDFLLKLKADDADEYHEFLANRGTPWGEEPSQPLAQCIGHLCALIVRKVDADCGSGPNAKGELEISGVIADKWVKRNAGVFSDAKR